EILAEDRYRQEFGRYFEFLQQGQGEQAAFAASFDASYEDLDRVLSNDKSARVHIFILPDPADDSPDSAAPRKLTPPEVRARLALVNLKAGRRAGALRLAAAALHDDPTSEQALRVAAEAQLEEGNYPASFAAVDQLSRRNMSADGLAECAGILTVL